MYFKLSVKTFENRYKQEKNLRAKIRLHILLLRRQKYTQQEIAGMVRVTQGTISNICRRFLKEGWQSVYDKPRSGKPAKLTAAEKEKLNSAMQHEFSDGKIQRGWQTKDVRSFMKEHFDQNFTMQHTRRIMHGMGMSWKVPRPQHKNRDEKSVVAFKKTSPGRFCLWQINTKSSA